MRFDLHVHAGPDVVARCGDDVDTARGYAEAGAGGLVLKGHCESTVGRARAAGRAAEIDVFGGIALNTTVGGLNPVAVAAALTAGARVIWLPTVDAAAHRDARLSHPPGCAPELPAGPALAVPPRDGSTEDQITRILQLVAAHDAVIATGHVSGEEAAWVVRRALAVGVTRILLTHPTFVVPALEPETVAELTELGAHAELTTYQLLHQPGMDADRLAQVARAVPADRLVLSSDSGQPDSPPGPEGLDLLVKTLAARGLDRGRLEAAAGHTPAALVRP